MLFGDVITEGQAAWAPWCGPCHMVGPVIEEITKECSDIKVCNFSIF